jgi:hypothetical protein
MMEYIDKSVLFAGGFIVLLYVLYRIVMYTRKKGGNADLWGTIFEGLTHYVQPQETLKEPKQYINKTQRKINEEEEDNLEYHP